LSSPEDHRAEIEAWQAGRARELMEPDSWLSVVGLFWLHPGVNTIGSDPRMDVVFPEQDVPPFLGTLTLRGQGSFEFGYAPGVGRAPSAEGAGPVPLGVQQVPEADTIPGEAGRITRTDTIAGEAEAVPGEAEAVPGEGGSVRFRVDSPEGGPVFRWGTLSWFVIERYGDYAIRLRDSASQARADFRGLETFPISSKWRILGHFHRYDPPRQIAAPNVLDIPSTSSSPGAVVFEVDGREFRLDVTGEPDARRFFLVFGDGTNGGETYAGGRFLSVGAPLAGDWIIIDFNEAYNPPCVFTPYATCPVPPDQNKLPIRIEAGEKMYFGAGH
jgi:uncharacterized protein (DUF1684 family)